ncbi:alpha/beta fold hydrolase [Pokkaliibacter sp. MBI-7]|uniref:alpha/beta hydrolase n=1 Tax=Pokkaliibacter sp. MBI-7 TaxID=3040600 RepID=UPI00244A0313|nr:alpha/beta fold hydrolase [Pokkaliibacter sp. MBI-7]MDH2435482.1 alpha/beta fold hydrolase [Pokkaliibacter sp. MBI-7]
MPPLGQSSFSLYQQQTRGWLAQHRQFQTTDHLQELQWNGPQEWRPPADISSKPQKGILLVHGLGDSPWSFHDLGEQLARQGFLVRTVLLPGHGSRPEDMLHVTLEDWQRVVDEQVTVLRKEVGQVYLGGFSTGGNLVTDYAYRHGDIAGLVLFSPAFKSDSRIDWLAPWISWARPWLRDPEAMATTQNPVRYLNVPTNGFAQFYRSSAQVQDDLAQAYTKPVFMVVAEHDSVLDTQYLLDTFSHRFEHPDSRLIWYGEAPATRDPRVIVRTDFLPEQRISQFSHMGMLFAPGNPLYGMQGSVRLCRNSTDAQQTELCEQTGQVWYSAWGYQQPGKVHARLTFNPYFEWQGEIMRAVLQ